MGRSVARHSFLSLGAAALIALLPVTLWTDSSLKSWLYVLGGCCECLGVALVAAPDLFPRLKEARDWTVSTAREKVRTAERGLRKILHLPPRGRVFEDAGTVVGHGHVSGEFRLGGTVRADAGIEERIADLTRRVDDQDSRLTDLTHEAKRVETDLRDEIKKTREELQRLAQDLVRTSAERHLDWRYAGLVLLFIGLGLSTAGNLVS